MIVFKIYFTIPLCLFFVSMNVYSRTLNCANANGSIHILNSTYAGGPPPRPEMIRKESKVYFKNQLIIHELNYFNGEIKTILPGQVNFDQNSKLWIEKTSNNYSGHDYYSIKLSIEENKAEQSRLIYQGWALCHEYWELRP